MQPVPENSRYIPTFWCGCLNEEKEIEKLCHPLPEHFEKWGETNPWIKGLTEQNRIDIESSPRVTVSDFKSSSSRNEKELVFLGCKRISVDG